MARKRVLCFASYFLPGFRAGGPIRSLQRIIETLSQDFDFGVVTRDRDQGATGPYSSLDRQRWTSVEGIRVWYLRLPYWSPIGLRRAISEFKPDLLYFHSFWDPAVVAMPLLLRRLSLIPSQLPVLVAPRGEFAPEALALKGNLKAVWLTIVRISGLYRGISWHASTNYEADQVRAQWGENARIMIAPDLPPRVTASAAPARRTKIQGSLRIVFLSRVAPMKNLDGALRILSQVRTPMSLDIFGTRESEEYWSVCEKRAKRLPPLVTVTFHGPVAPDMVLATMASYDLFFLPTLGENFGHVILEAMLSGCPVLISDRTPWRQLQERTAGYALALERPESFVAALEQFAAMDNQEFRQWSQGAAKYAHAYCEDPRWRNQARGVLNALLDKSDVDDK
jgi:glycosyltransferase involved in cell wall biosynthesis